MKKWIFAAALASSLTLPMAIAPAAAQSRDEVRDSRREVREERRELREAQRELRQDQRDGGATATTTGTVRRRATDHIMPTATIVTGATIANAGWAGTTASIAARTVGITAAVPTAPPA